MSLVMYFHKTTLSPLLQLPSGALLQVGYSYYHRSHLVLDVLFLYLADPGDYQELTVEDLFFDDITATNNRTCIEVSIEDDDLLEATENFTVQVVPDPFSHPDGLPLNVFLEPDLTVVEIMDNDCK